LRKSVLFGFITVVPPGLDIALVPDSMVVATGRVGEGFSAIRARVGFLTSMNILVCFEVELGREALTALRADNRANLQVNGPNVPLHQTRARLETAFAPTWIVPNTLGLSAANPLDVIVGVDRRWGAGGGRRFSRLVLCGKGRRGRSRRRLGRAPSGMRVAREVAAVIGARGVWVGVRGGRWVEGCWQTLGLLMVGRVGTRTDSSIKRWGAVSEGAGDELGVRAARVLAPSERLEIVQGQRGFATREDLR